MKVVIAGGSGNVGEILVDHFLASKHVVVVLSRREYAREGIRTARWDGETLGDWARELDGADVLINLAGRSVNCRYHAENAKQMMDSRVLSTRVLAEAVANCGRQPKVWLQASTATIYAHSVEPNDDIAGIIGGSEPNLPESWKLSYRVAKAWEAEFDAIETTARKVKLRSAMTMGAQKGSIFDVLRGLARRGVLGTFGNGGQFVSWIHERDFARVIDFLVVRDDLSGAVNLSSPNPIPNREFNRILREMVGAKLRIPSPKWLLEIGAWVRQTETELILKSRCVFPKRLLDAGFEFEFPTWSEAASDLATRLANRN